MDAPIHYIQMPPGVWKTDLHRLLAEVPWEDRVEARREAFMAETPLSYTYGRPPGTRTYVAVPFAAGVDQVLVEVNRALQSVESGWGRLNGAVLNCYLGDRNALGWHADDSPEMDPSRPIVTVSLGAERDIQFIQFRTTADHRDAIMRVGSPHIETLTLGHGSAAIMKPGMQQGWFHRIPKSSVSNIGPRISLTFRGYLSEVDQIDRHHASSLADEVEVERLGADYFDS